MLARPTLRRNLDQNETEKSKGKVRPAEQRYRLRVDNQEKQSFESKEAALSAGQAIKKAYPLVIVTVVDADTDAAETVT
jgi:hypothetical protein